MAEFKGEYVVVIQAPITAVYEYISDFPRHVEWNHQPTKMSKMTDGPVGVGSVFRTKEQAPSNAPWVFKFFGPLLAKLFGTTGYTEAEITVLEPNRRVAWTARAPLKKGGNFAKAEWEINLASEGEGTRVTQGMHFHLLGKMGERINPEKSAQDAREEMAVNLSRLKTIVETQTKQGTASNRVALA